MNAERRRTAIARFISEHDGADVAMLAKHFSVSPMTIRRDRKVLASQNKIAPTHGGAVPVDYMVYGELPYAKKVDINLDKKKVIAQRAVDLITDNSCIILDAGTTTLELAKLIVNKKLTVITVDLHIALFLAQSSTIKVFTPGGEVDREIQGQLDTHAMNYLESVNASISFIGAASWDCYRGATSSTVAKQGIKKNLIKQAEKSVLLADSTKFGLCSPWNVNELKNFSYIITDEDLSETDRKAVSQVGGVFYKGGDNISYE